ncbi:hypothetical protein ACNJYD_10075 [Bradyrhizobium sp. DASA03005]|uniref:hypothetical protein n=1 Tax=Bradyrhizobium sp. SPXBL-02 TaxID=3395912 RepID=UPI003F712929
MKDKLIVCLNASKMLDSARGQQVDIRELVSKVPSLNILAGDPNTALSVEVEHRYAGALRRSVEGVCTVGEDTDFDLLDGGKTGRSFTR